MRNIVSICAAMLVVAGAAFAANLSPAQKQVAAVEAAWSKAYVQKDVATISSIVADDWIGRSDNIESTSKAELIAMVKSGDLTITSIELHDLKIRVIGNVAVVQGGDQEKSSFKGKDISGTYTWMDVFVKRGGKWVAIATQQTKVTP